MRYQLGCDLSYRIKSETLFIFNVEVAELVRHKDLREMLTIKPDLQRRRYTVIRTQESVPALSKSRHEHFREHFLHSLSILGKGGQPLVRKRLWREVVDFAQHSLLQPFHDSGLDGFDIGQAEEGPGLSRRALNVNVDGCLHGRVALQSLDGAAFRSERGGRQGSAAMPGLPWLAGSAIKLYTESQVRSKI